MQFKSPLLGQAKPNQPNSQWQPFGYLQATVSIPQQPRQKSKKSWIALIAVVVTLSLIACGNLQAQKSQSSTSTSQAINATRPPAMPTMRAAGAKVKRVNAGPAILGADSSAFIATYGQPNSNSRPANGITIFALYNNPHMNDLSVTTLGTKVFSVLLHAPTDQSWDQAHVINACLSFMPPDRVYKRSLTLYDPQGKPMAIQRVYNSASLAGMFPASKFTDENGTQTTAGTFGMVLNYALNTTTYFSSCAVQVGLQGTNSGA